LPIFAKKGKKRRNRVYIDQLATERTWWIIFN